MAIRKRQRPESTYLSEFSLANVCTENARLDKFQIKFPNFSVRRNNSEYFNDAIERIKRRTLFCGGGADDKLRILKKVRGENKSWLTEGIGTIRFIKDSHQYSFPSHFSINFNKFWTCNAHRFEAGMLNPDEWDVDVPRIRGTTLYQTNNVRLRKNATRTLDQKENVLFGEDWSKTRYVSHCFYMQVQKLIDTLSTELRPFGRSNINLDTSDAILTYAEVCFDLFEPDALSRINNLIPKIEQITQTGEFSNFKKTLELNALGCKFNATKNIIIAIYAKTAQRIRCEVRYTKSLRTVLGRDAPKRKHANSLESLCEVIDVAIDDAVERIHLLLQEVEQIQEPQTLNIAPMLASLMQEFSVATNNNKAISTAILNQLINKGNVTSTSKTDAALKSLCERGILTKPKATKRSAKAYYRIHNRFLKLFEALRAANHIS